MFSNKCHFVFLLVCCLIAATAAASLDSELLIRRERSPQHGSVVISGSKDHQSGRQAGVQYNHNLYTSRDGRGSIDAYANAQRNFDHNRNNFGGGVQGTWRF